MSVIVMKMPRQQTPPDNIGMNAVAITSRNRQNRCRSFHFRYLDLCRSKNTAPVAEIRKNNKDQVTLDFFGDKLNYNDWQLITDAINCDQMLHVLSIRLRKCQGTVVSHIDGERKARLFRQKPVIFTKFVFNRLIDALSNCIETNKNLQVLHLEGLPLSDDIESIVKSLSTNKSIKDVSFARSNIYDAGCEAICHTIKYMENIEKLNLSDTGLTTKGAEYVANMIKIQKISRYTEGWQQSLRYNNIDPESIAGLRIILLARNPRIGDEGLEFITEVLKEDVWVKVIDMENCGLTDHAANLLIECLNVNNYIMEFNISGNPGISKFLLHKIGLLLRKGEVEMDARTGEELLRDFSEGRLNSAELAKKSKLSMQQLIEQLKKTNEQLQLERRLRLKAEQLNEKLQAQVKAYEIELANLTAANNIPEGFIVVKNTSLQSIMRDRNSSEQPDDQLTFVDDQYEEETTTLNNYNYVLKQAENGLQFLTPLPEPTVSPTISARSRDTQPQQQQQQLSSQPQPTKIRKVKSEMKYIEPPTRQQVNIKKKDVKSDYDYADSDVPRFEANIGDTANTNRTSIHQQIFNNNKHNINLKSNNNNNQIIDQQTSNSRRSVRYASNVQIIKKYEIDEISLPTTRSHISVASSTESDTLRCADGMDMLTMDLKHVMRNTSPTEHGQGEGSGTTSTATATVAPKCSPRSLFLGLCEQ